ncbi:MAG: BamA/TamA family outer membrane protein, partial [Bdellovibrionota bacterium]
EGLQTLYANLVVPPAVLASDQGLLSSVVWSVVRDKRNNRFETSDGNYQSISMETAGIGGDKKFIKGIANNRLYKRVFGDLVLRNSTEVGAIGSFGPAVPSAEKFYLGGPNNMKGFGAFLLSPFVTGFDPGSGQTINTPVGGLYEAFSLFEAEYPIIRDAGIKAVVFFDVGNTWDPAFTNFGGIRADVGFGIRWFSPIGPLRFEWGFPINPQPGEQNPAFQFFIGPPF